MQLRAARKVADVVWHRQSQMTKAEQIRPVQPAAGLTLQATCMDAGIHTLITEDAFIVVALKQGEAAGSVGGAGQLLAAALQPGIQFSHNLEALLQQAAA